MTIKEAQNIAERMCNNGNTDNITIKQIKDALRVMANYIEDNEFNLKQGERK